MILPSAVQCAGRTTPTRSFSWKAPGPPVRASTTTASPIGTEKCALSPVARARSSSTGAARLVISISSSALAASANSGRPMR